MKYSRVPKFKLFHELNTAFLPEKFSNRKCQIKFTSLSAQTIVNGSITGVFLI